MITSEIILAFILIVLVIERFYIQRAIQQERKEWTKGMLAKNLRELTDNEALERLPDEEEPQQSDVVSMDDVIEDDKVFDLHIAAVKKQAEEEFENATKIT
jgi:DNA-binding HxlR family transcriptional regulator